MLDPFLRVFDHSISGLGHGDLNLGPFGQLLRLLRKGKLCSNATFDLVLNRPRAVVNVVAVCQSAEDCRVPLEVDIVVLLCFLLPEVELPFDKLCQLRLK